MTIVIVMSFFVLAFSLGCSVANTMSYYANPDRKYIQLLALWTMIVWLSVIQIIAADIPS